MSDKPNNDIGPLVIAVALVVLGLIVMNIVAMIVSLVIILLVIAALYFGSTTGYKLAMDSEVWESRRIAKSQKLQAARERERAYFTAQGKEWMAQVVDNHYDDKERELYQNDGNRVETITKNIRQVKEIFK